MHGDFRAEQHCYGWETLVWQFTYPLRERFPTWR